MRNTSLQSITVYRTRIIRFLDENNGNWWNVQQISEKLPRPSINRINIRDICEELVERGFVEKRDSQDQRSKTEYKISSTGLEYTRKFQNLTDKEKYVFGILD